MDALLEKIAMHPYWSQPQHMVGLAFVIIFSVMLVIVIVSTVRKIERCRVRIEAEIVDSVLRTDRDPDGGCNEYYVPVYSYFYEGMTYRLEGRNASSGRPYQVGKRVTLYVDSEYPSQFAERGADIGKALVFGLSAALFLSVGILLLLTEEEFS